MLGSYQNSNSSDDLNKSKIQAKTLLRDLEHATVVPGMSLASGLILSASNPSQRDKSHLGKGSGYLVSKTQKKSQPILSSEPEASKKLSDSDSSHQHGNQVLLPEGLRPAVSRAPTFQPPSTSVGTKLKNRRGSFTDSIHGESERQAFIAQDDASNTAQPAADSFQMLPDHRNPLKALQRLRQNPDSTEFVYLRPYRIDEITPLNPYHLEIVPHANIDDKNFFTLSSFGVTHFSNGIPEFTELEQWKREHFLFNNIIKIHVFKKYRVWKSYKVWRDSVRYGKMRKSGKALQKNLFWMNPAYQKALFKVRSSCMDLRVMKLHDARNGVLYTLEDFFNSQQAQRGKVMEMLKGFWDGAVDTARTACISTLESLEDGLFGSKAADASAPQFSNTEKDKGSPRAESFRYTVMASKRVVQRRLYYFLRLCDYIIFNTLHSMVTDSVSDLVSFVEGVQSKQSAVVVKDLKDPKNNSKSHNAIFLTEIVLDNGDLSFSPASTDFESEFESIIEGFVLTVSGSIRLLNHEDLEQYTELYDPETEENEASTVADIVQNDEDFQGLLNALKNAIEKAFAACDEYLNSFEPFRQMMFENEQLDIAQMKAGAETGEVLLHDFKEKYDCFIAQRESIRSLPDTQECLIFLVDCKNFKELVSPSPATCLEKLNNLLPQLANAKQKKISDEVNAANAVLQKTPTTVAEFVARLDFIAEQTNRKDEMDAEFKNLQEHFALMEKYMTIPRNDWASFQMLIPEHAQMKNMLELLDSTKEDEMSTWGTRLSDDIKEFHHQIDSLKTLSQDPQLLEDHLMLEPILEITAELKEQANGLERAAKENQSLQAVFGQQVERYPVLDEIVADINLKRGMWEALRDITTVTESWKLVLIQDMPVKEWDATVQKWFKVANRADRELPSNPVAPKLKAIASTWKDLIPACGDLKNPALQDRHWEKLEQIVGFKIDRDPEPEDPLTLGYLLSRNIMAFREDIQRISTEATQEAVLEEMLSKIKSVWQHAEFTLHPFKEQKDVFILAGVDEIQALLDDSMVTMGTILSSRFVKGIRSEVEVMEGKLKSLQNVLDEWLNVQKNWMYLEPIFSAPDIQRQLPSEAKLFSDIDKGLRNLMKKVSENPNCMRIGTQNGQAETFAQWNEILEKIQKQLEDYLEFKRMAFPRFYFLSNDELLEILAQTRNVQAVQPHMMKCFDGIKSIDFGGQHKMSPLKVFDENSTDIYGMISPETEYVTLGKNLKARGEVENWLSNVEKKMVESLRQLAKDAVMDYQNKVRHEWVMDHAAQNVILCSQIFWCRGSEEALDGKLVEGNPLQGVSAWYAQTVDYLSALVVLVRGELTKLQRGSLVALITIDVHNRDILEYLMNDKTESKDDFNWQMRIRYYWDDSLGTTGDCKIQQVTAEFLFAHEYLGASFRLVITPLSDRCYMTLTGALELKLGGAPAGPAGTGKTETTKDLAKALGRQCVVFNCGDNLDYKFMGKFFKGLSQCGAWACFDEFNRINVEVLSVVAQQIITIQIALRQKLTEFEFEGRRIRLIDTFGVFITMNPGYAGRTELPDNLKALFRPMSMMVPDYSLIAEISLFAEGFETAKPLSKKMTKLYKLASEQVSAQPHYDFGMRAIKSVLVMAGSGKRNNPHFQEDIVMILAMCDSNIPKFLKDDVILFNAIVQDLFPGVFIPKQDTGALLVSIKERLETAHLKETEQYLLKAIQLYEVLGIRFGVMQVGPTGGGKTTIARILAEAMGKLREQGSHDQEHQPVETYCFNPKSISMGELYGNYNLLTNEWTDGLGSTIIRNANSDQSDTKKYICFDGPIDAIWIENMNTVLDDNRTLCLPNGERIKLNPKTLRMLFEVEDCAVASPATVSRLGVVWFPPEALGNRPPIETWLDVHAPDDMSAELRALFLSLYDQAAEKLLRFLRRNCREAIPSVDNNLLMSCCKLFQSLFVSEKGADLSSPDVAEVLKKMFAFALVWSIGGNVDTVEGKEKFSDFFREEITFARFPNTGTVYDYVFDKESKDFRPWEDTTPAFKFDKNLNFSEILVPTRDTTRYSFFLGALIEVKRGCLFVGDTGTGKSVIMSDALNRFVEPLSLLPFTINFSAQTSSKRTQEMIEMKLDKRRKGVVGPPVGKTLVCFVDDVNMPAREEYGAQPPIELLRLVVDTVEHCRPCGGIWDRKKLFWSDIVDTVLVSACGPPGGGRNVVTGRFFRMFNMLNISPPSERVLKVIFTSILEGHLNDFSADIKALCRATVDASIEIYQRISKEMLPTPAKSHYTFNLRDLSKVFQGILSLKVQHCATITTFARLWTHENQRVFQDRLIDTQDKSTFSRWLHEMLKRKFAQDVDFEETFVKSPILFGDYLKMGVTGEDRVYEPINDVGKLPKLLDTYLEEYNLASPKTMNLVFFMDAIEHVSRLARIIRSPRGNAMLVGLGGSGKQSLTRLASFMAEYRNYQIELTRGYGNNEFREDLKKLFIIAGVERKSVVFLFTDSQIVNEGFVEDINGILNAGDVPNLFAPDEKDRVVADVREYAAKIGRPLTKDSVYQTFISCVQANLHCVLCMSPVGEAFRRRCKMFPSLINCCTIDWYLPWPEEALLNVAERIVTTVEGVSDEHKVSLAAICPIIHCSVEEYSDKFYSELRRKFYISPKSYLDMIQLYSKLLGGKRKELSEQKDRFLNGLAKMEEVGKVIESAKQDLAKLEPVLKEKSASTDKLLKEVAVDKESASKVEAVVGKEAAEVEEFAAGVRVIQEDAQKDLDEALPALNAAVTALNSLSKSDITEVKSFAKPPPLVQTTMEAVCVLLGRKADWDTSKKLLGESDFTEQLVNFDKDNIDPKRLKLLQKYIAMEDFNPDSVGKVSRAAKGLCMWCRAMDVYARVAKDVEPKKLKLAAANSQLDTAMTALNEKKNNLRTVQEKVAALETQLNAALVEKKSLSDQAALCEARLSRSVKLTSSLGDEQVNWTQQAALLAEQLERLVGDVFLGAACVAYIGPFTGTYRSSIINHWVEEAGKKKIPVSDKFVLKEVLAKPVEIRAWNISGLPADEVSVDNGVITKNTTRWPLAIDPQMQANKWIKSMEEQHGLRLIKLTDGRYLQTIEACVRNGNPLLLEDVGEELDPALEPILMKQLFKQGGRTLIRLGEQNVDYDENFRFYMTSKLPNPHYLPDVCIKATIINFMITLDGLEDQLLGDVVRRERPDLESAKDKLVVSMANDKKQLGDLQDKVLKLLKEAEGMILDNEPLINTLQQSKVTSSMINKRVVEAEETNANIAAAREGYRSVATRGSLIYFVIADLPNIDPMYQYSLEYFKKLFNQCIDSSKRSPDLQVRLNNLMAFTTEFMYKNVCRGLFERHKLIFSFLITTAIMRNFNQITTDEWNFILRGGTPPHEMPKNPDPAFLSDFQWDLCCALQKDLGDVFGGAATGVDLTTHIASNTKDWKVWASADAPHRTPLPKPWDGLTGIRFMCVLKIFRQEKLVFSTETYVADKMGKQFTESPPIVLAEIFPDTSASTPIIFVLSTGSDPTQSLIKFAEERGCLHKLQTVSLGQGQGPVAERLITAGCKKGEWVCLMNCHLATSWMGSLEKIVEGFATHGVEDDGFRLWLTSMPSTSFPVSVLQNGIKLTNEPPRGIRANLIGTFTTLGDTEWSCNDAGRGGRDEGYWKKLLVGLAFFHAVVQERRKYGALGWNIRYEFNTSDILCAKDVLKMFVQKFEAMPWMALVYITGHVNYGGRVTDDQDRRCLMAILDTYYKGEMVVQDDGYKFSESGTYYSPPVGSYADMMAYLHNLPMVDNPEVFGMHDNANITFQLQETQMIYDTVLSLQPRVGSGPGAGHGKSPEEVVDDMAQTFEEAMPALFDRERGAPGMFETLESGAMRSLDTVLLQEMDRFNTLVATMRRTLKDLRKAIKGLVVMSVDLEAMFTNFRNNQVPGLWTKVAYPCLKPLASWIKDFQRRIEFFQGWCERGQPKSFWLPGFFYPQGFMTGALQTHARRYRLPIDTLNFGFVVKSMEGPEDVGDAPDDGIFISGLYLEAARWDRRQKRLKPSNPGEMMSLMPIIHFTAVQNYVPSPADYQAPLYKTNLRAGVLNTTGQSTNYILDVSLPTDESPRFWILMATAMCTMTND